jgi:hypothetical protein
MKQDLRCIGPDDDHQLQRCRNRYNPSSLDASGTEGWDYVALHPIIGWVCPSCRGKFRRVFDGKGLERAVGLSPR